MGAREIPALKARPYVFTLILDGHILGRPLIWDGEAVELSYGEDDNLCGIVDVAISDREDLNSAISRALGREGTEGTKSSLPTTVWSVTRDGQAYEVVSVQEGRGPQNVTVYRGGVYSRVVEDDRRQTVYLRRARPEVSGP